MTPHRAVSWLGVLASLTLVAGCRKVPQTADTTATPITRPGSSYSLPEPYGFLSHPGVGMESVDSIWASLPYDSIYLRREPCFGTCPMYSATLYRGGRARYTGERFVEKVGSYTGEVTLQDYGRISYLLDKLGFMNLPDSFAIAATDLPGATMAVGRKPEGAKAVHDYGYVGPVELWAMMQVFDGIVNRIQWEKTSP